MLHSETLCLSEEFPIDISSFRTKHIQDHCIRFVNLFSLVLILHLIAALCTMKILTGWTIVILFLQADITPTFVLLIKYSFSLDLWFGSGKCWLATIMTRDQSRTHIFTWHVAIVSHWVPLWNFLFFLLKSACQILRFGDTTDLTCSLIHVPLNLALNRFEMKIKLHY